MIGLNQSPKYRAFIKSRNEVLEQFRRNNLNRIDNIVKQLCDLCCEIVAGHMTVSDTQSLKYLETRLDPLFTVAEDRSLFWAQRLRRISYALAYAGEVEALSRAKNVPHTVNLRKELIDATEYKQAPAGGELADRFHLYFSRLKRRVLDKAQMAIVNAETPKEAAERVRDAFPKKVRVLRPKKILCGPRRIQESDDQAIRQKFTVGARMGVTVSHGYIDKETWEEVLEEWMIGIPTRDADEMVDHVYRWEVEQEVTQDFVQSVRDGQVDAAEENGYTDFIWIAVTDDRTDACCLWRDGLTTTEIEKQLRGKHSDDECDAVVPPAHFNCRCDLAPVTDELPVGTRFDDLGDFETWLTPK